MRVVLTLVLLWLFLPGTAFAGEDTDQERVDRNQVSTLVEKLQQATVEKDGAALQSAFDIDEIVASWERTGYLRGVSEKDLAGARTKLSALLRGVLARRPLIQPFLSYEIRSIREGPRAGTLVAYVRLRSEELGVTKLYLHLKRHGDSLRIFEVDDLDSGLGYVAFMGSLLVEARTANGGGWLEVAANLQRAQVLVANESFEEAYELLKPAQEQDCPDVLHAFVQVVLAGASLGAGEFARAIDHANQVEELKPNTPVVHYIKTYAWNLLDKPEQALAEAKSYTAEAGDDPDIDLETGKALLALKRSAEALAPLRRNLLQDPVDAEALAYFACVSTDEHNKELGAYFDRLENPSADFPDMAEICTAAEAPRALRALTELYAQVEPADFQVPFYRGKALLMEGKAAEAAPLLLKSLGQLGNRKMDAEEKGPYIEAWLDAMAQQHKHLEAFDQAPDRHRALTWLADGIAVHGDADLLSELLARAAKDEALLPWRRFYSAEVHYLRSQFEDAIRVLTPLRKELMTRAEEDDAIMELVWKVEDRLIRSAVRTTGADLEAALRLAKEIAERDQDLDYLIIVLAHKGDVPATTAAVLRAVEAGRDPTWILEDEDIGEILAGEAYAALRKELLR